MHKLLYTIPMMVTLLTGCQAEAISKPPEPTYYTNTAMGEMQLSDIKVKTATSLTPVTTNVLVTMPEGTKLTNKLYNMMLLVL